MYVRNLNGVKAKKQIYYCVSSAPLFLPQIFIHLQALVWSTYIVTGNWPALLWSFLFIDNELRQSQRANMWETNYEPIDCGLSMPMPGPRTYSIPGIATTIKRSSQSDRQESTRKEK